MSVRSVLTLPRLNHEVPPGHLLNIMQSLSASLVSVNVGQPRSVEFGGRSVLTSIFKEPVKGRRRVAGHNIEGDRQSDLRVHGGPYKAIYLYPEEHYAYWTDRLDLEKLPYGAFGENLTTRGLLEENVCIGDQFRIGSAILQVTQPRMPCFKLQLRFSRNDMVKLFWQSGYSGVYFSIRSEGEIGPGDTVEKIASGPEQVTVQDIVRLYKGDEWNNQVRDRALRSPLYGSWKSEIQARLTEA